MSGQETRPLVPVSRVEIGLPARSADKRVAAVSEGRFQIGEVAGLRYPFQHPGRHPELRGDSIGAVENIRELGVYPVGHVEIEQAVAVQRRGIVSQRLI